MTRALRIHPCPPVAGAIRPPGSKSITNRAMICAALAKGTSRLSGVLESEDTEVMIAAWQQLGLEIDVQHDAAKVEVRGCGGLLPQARGELFIGNSGTSIRFLTAALAACHGQFTLDGVSRMRERPIGDLLDALRQLGAKVESRNPSNANCPPVFIDANGLHGGRATVAGNISSQFLSGLMMAAPLAEREVTLEVTGELVSVPYVEMTRQVMESFGARVAGPTTGPMRIDTHRRYVGTQYAIEPDASAASYFWGAAAISGGKATVQGLNRNSLQGDVRFCEVLKQMGCAVHYQSDAIVVEGAKLRGVDVNMADISDTVQTLAAIALFAEGETRVRGVAHNRVKETDRIGDLARELRKLGAGVQEYEDGMSIQPPTQIQATQIATYGDHRMAMSLALVGLKASGIAISDPDCTKKTYPAYWKDLASFAGCGIEHLD